MTDSDVEKDEPPREKVCIECRQSHDPQRFHGVSRRRFRSVRQLNSIMTPMLPKGSFELHEGGVPHSPFSIKRLDDQILHHNSSHELVNSSQPNQLIKELSFNKT